MSLTVPIQSSAKQFGTNVTSVNFNFTGVTAGSTLIVVILMYRSTSPVNPEFIVSDADGKYTRDVFVNNASNLAAGIFRLTNATAGTHSITVSGVSTGNYFTFTVQEWPGTLLLDSNNYLNIASGTAITTGPTRITPATEVLVIATFTAGANQASITVEVTSPVWTVIQEQLNWSAQNSGESVYKVVPGSSAYTANWTIASSTVSSAAIAAYIEQSAGGGGGGTSGEDNHVFLG